jgi:hypothetical protein
VAGFEDEDDYESISRGNRRILELNQQDIIGQSDRLLNGRTISLLKSDFVGDGMSE